MRNCDDIQEVVEEILCRLPSAAHVCRLKCVSKPWCNLISQPYFLGRFLRIQREKQASTPSIMINIWGDTLLHNEVEFAKRMKRLLKIMGNFTRVIATCNDLVLSCKDGRVRYHCDYYIGNPWTMQMVTLPRVVSHRRMTLEPAVGFICDPYYDEKEENTFVENTWTNNNKKRDNNIIIKTNAEFKFKVVRLLPPHDHESYEMCFLFDIQVFSSEIGEWRDYVASCRQGFDFSLIDEPCLGVATNNGMLYWSASNGDVVGLGPFVSNDKINGHDDSSYQIHVIKFVDKLDDVLPVDYVECVRYLPRFCIGLHGENMHLVTYKRDRLLIWELSKEELEKMAFKGSGEVGREHRMPIVIEEIDDDGVLNCVAFDPNELDICYVWFDNQRPDQIYKCNIRSGESSMIPTSCDYPWNIFGCRRTLWPTPIPTILKHSL